MERAVLLLSTLTHPYVFGNPWQGDTPVDVIPRQLSEPLIQVTSKLNRVPVTTHCSISLHNWSTMDEATSVTNDQVHLGNIKLLHNIIGGMDEDWFFLDAVEVEARAAPCFPSIIRLAHNMQKHNEANNNDNDKMHAQISETLQIITRSLTEMRKSLKRMYQQNDPYIFYERVRTYLNGWEKSKFPTGVQYSGCFEGQGQWFHGGSAAQSSTLHSIDEFLQVKHKSPYMMEMRKYMAAEHRAFINEVAEFYSNDGQFSIKSAVENSKNADLQAVYNKCVEELSLFRTSHITMVHEYIVKQSKVGMAAVGTGGTSAVEFLSQLNKETTQQKAMQGDAK